MIKFDIDQTELDVITHELDATEKAVRLAMRRTIRRMSGWLRVRAGRAIRKETNLKADVLRRRLKNMKFKTRKDEITGGVWIGYNPIDVSRLPYAVQDEVGVVAGQGEGAVKYFDGAFMGPKPGVKSSKLRGGAFIRKGKKRNPIERVGYDIAKEVEKTLDDDIFKGFEEQFYKTFEADLKWRMQTQK